MARNPHKDQEVSSSRHGALLSPGDRSPGRMLSFQHGQKGANPWLRAPSPPPAAGEEDKPAFRLSQSLLPEWACPSPAGQGGGHVHRLGGRGCAVPRVAMSLDLHHPLGDLILPQEGHIGMLQLIGVAHFPFELLLFPHRPGPDAPLAESCVAKEMAAVRASVMGGAPAHQPGGEVTRPSLRYPCSPRT